MTLPQGAQTAITLVNTEREAVSVMVAQAGSQAVSLTVPESGEVVLLAAGQPGLADILLVPKAAQGVARKPVALSVLVESARPRREGDGPVTLELTLPSVDAADKATVDDVVPMLADKDMPGWTRGRRMAANRPQVHWVRGSLERARVPAGWRLQFPAAGRRMARGSSYWLWEAPAQLGRWQWREEYGGEFYASEFVATTGPLSKSSSAAVSAAPQ